MFYLGEIVPAQTHFEQEITLYDPQQHHAHAFLYGGADSGVVCLSHTALLLWLRGYPDQALESMHKARTLSRELSHPFSLAYSLIFAGLLHQFRHEVPAAQEQAEAAIAVSNEHGFPFLLALGTILQGWALAEQGQGEEGTVQIRQGLAAFQATGAVVGQPFLLAMLAEAYRHMEQTAAGLTAVAEALAVVDKTEEHVLEAELYRLQGELLLRHAVPDKRQAETAFRQALNFARRQQAKSLELRVAISLSRLWQQQGKRDAPRELLAPIYHWFTEGFDTPDLQEAKALLDELGG